MTKLLVVVAVVGLAVACGSAATEPEPSPIPEPERTLSPETTERIKEIEEAFLFAYWSCKEDWFDRDAQLYSDAARRGAPSPEIPQDDTRCEVQVERVNGLDLLTNSVRRDIAIFERCRLEEIQEHLFQLRKGYDSDGPVGPMPTRWSTDCEWPSFAR